MGAKGKDALESIQDALSSFYAGLWKPQVHTYLVLPVPLSPGSWSGSLESHVRSQVPTVSTYCLTSISELQPAARLVSIKYMETSSIAGEKEHMLSQPSLSIPSCVYLASWPRAVGFLTGGLRRSCVLCLGG